MKKLLLVVGVLVVSLSGVVVINASTNMVKSSEYYRLEQTDLYLDAGSCDVMTVNTQNVEVKANFDVRNPIDYNESVVSLEVSGGNVKGTINRTQRASLNEIPVDLFLAGGNIDIDAVNDAYSHLGYTEHIDSDGLSCMTGEEMTTSTHFLDEGMYYAE